MYPLEWNEPCEKQDEEYDIHLNNGRLMEHFHEGNMTYRVKGIQEETPERFLEVSPELAKERGIQSGTWIDVTSRTGTIRVKALVTDRVRGKQVYLPLTSSEGPVNVLTGSKVDKDVHTPAYKETAVKLKVLDFRPHRESAAPAELPLLRQTDTAAWCGGGAQVEAHGLPHAGRTSCAGANQQQR